MKKSILAAGAVILTGAAMAMSPMVFQGYENDAQIGIQVPTSYSGNGNTLISNFSNTPFSLGDTMYGNFGQYGLIGLGVIYEGANSFSVNGQNYNYSGHLPIYLGYKYDFTPSSPEGTFYLDAKLGYSALIDKTTTDNLSPSDGGLYYSAGAGYQFPNNIFLEINYAANQESLNAGNQSYTVTYQRVGLMGGYSFNIPNVGIQKADSKTPVVSNDVSGGGVISNNSLVETQSFIPVQKNSELDVSYGMQTVLGASGSGYSLVNLSNNSGKGYGNNIVRIEYFKSVSTNNMVGVGTALTFGQAYYNSGEFYVADKYNTPYLQHTFFLLPGYFVGRLGFNTFYNKASGLNNSNINITSEPSALYYDLGMGWYCNTKESLFAELNLSSINFSAESKQSVLGDSFTTKMTTPVIGLGVGYSFNL